MPFQDDEDEPGAIVNPAPVVVPVDSTPPDEVMDEMHESGEIIEEEDEEEILEESGYFDEEILDEPGENADEEEEVLDDDDEEEEAADEEEEVMEEDDDEEEIVEDGEPVPVVEAASSSSPPPAAAEDELIMPPPPPPPAATEPESVPPAVSAPVAAAAGPLDLDEMEELDHMDQQQQQQQEPTRSQPVATSSFDDDEDEEPSITPVPVATPKGVEEAPPAAAPQETTDSAPDDAKTAAVENDSEPVPMEEDKEDEAPEPEPESEKKEEPESPKKPGLLAAAALMGTGAAVATGVTLYQGNMVTPSNSMDEQDNLLDDDEQPGRILTNSPQSLYSSIKVQKSPVMPPAPYPDDDDDDYDVVDAGPAATRSAEPAEQAPAMMATSANVDEDAVEPENRLTGDDGEKDVEMGEGPQPNDGGDEAAAADAADKKETEKDKKKKEGTVMGGMCSSRLTQVLLALLALLAVAAIVVMILLIVNNQKKSSSSDNNVPLPPPPTTPSLSPSRTNAITSSPIHVPTFSPTASNGGRAWEVVGGPFSGSPSSGTSVAMDGRLIAVGAPKADAVDAYFFNSAGKWLLLGQVPAVDPSSQFGAALDIAGNVMVVGAPDTNLNGTSTPAGAAYLYKFNNLISQWESVKTPILGDTNIFAANEALGSAVAIADLSDGTYRVALGAPKSNTAALAEAGRVYTYDYTGLTSKSGTLTSLEGAPILGKTKGDRLGFAVDVSPDGMLFLAGAPSSDTSVSHNGYATMYGWNGTGWDLLFTIEGEDNEYFGSSVHFFAADNRTFAIGGPNYQNGTGRVVVYNMSDDSGAYTQIGDAVVGSAGEGLGSAGGLSGGASESGLSLILATAKGLAKRYDYNMVTNQWARRFSAADTGFDEAFAIAASNDADTFVAGDGASSTIIVFNAPANATVTTAAPVAPVVPTSAPVAAPVSTLAPVVAGSPTTSPIAATGSPSSSPVSAGTTPSPSAALSVAPTKASGTLAPTAANMTWVVVGGPFTTGVSGVAGYGSALASTDSFLAVAAPLVLSVGGVLTYVKGSDGAWTSSKQLFGSETDGNFGYALSTTGSAMLVGAPYVNADGTTQPVGAAYYYEGSPSAGWTQVGSTLRGDSGVYATGEQFGKAVAMSSSNRRVAVGAPGSSLDLVMNRGRVYVMDYDSSTSTFVLAQDFVGAVSGDAFGTALDLSSSGNVLAVGAPQANEGSGMVSFYELTGSTWTNFFTLNGESGDALGSSVKFLSSDGSVVAMGAPQYNGGSGRVLVYERSGNNMQEKYPALTGTDAGSKIGDTKKMDGSGSSLVVATAAGEVYRYDYQGSAWAQIGPVLDPNYSNLYAVATSSGVQTVVVGGDEASALYQLA